MLKSRIVLVFFSSSYRNGKFRRALLSNMKRVRLRVIKMVLIILVCILFIPFLLGYVMNYLSKDKTVNPLILEKLVINEAIQWISVSEEPSVNKKPVVLFLHG